MSDYELDVSTWRCGMRGENLFGGGLMTRLLNEEGYMCCLGQFAKQKGVSDEYMLDISHPSHLNRAYDSNFVDIDDFGNFCDTPLVAKLMGINDNPTSTPKEKIDRIQDILEREGHTLTVINEHLLEG